MTSNQQTVSNSFQVHRYFVMNVIKGLTYQIYTCSSISSSYPVQMTVFEEGIPSGPVLASSQSNAGNTCSSDADGVYLSWTATLSGQVRVLINRRLNCSSTTGSTFTVDVNVSGGSNTQDNQAAVGSDSWIGHIYDGTNSGIAYNGSFANYLGYYTQTETFNETFGGGGNDTYCFGPVNSNGTDRADVRTVSFSVRYRMTSTKHGLYIVDMGADDGNRLAVDGNLVFNYWSDKAYAVTNDVLMNLTGNSTLVYDFYESGGGEQVSFQNLTLVLGNNLTINLTQSLCPGSSGSAISGDAFGTLPAGLSNPSYQWTYSTTPGGARTNISGATSSTYTPNTSGAPFNTPGTYYIYRNASVTSTNNYGASPYTATNESNAATLIVNALAIAPTSVTGTSTICSGSSSTLSASGGLIAYYPFSSNGNDVSGSGLNLSGSGGVFTDGGINFNGNLYQSAVTPILNTDKHTISFYIKFTTAPTSWEKIFGYEPSGSDRSPGIWTTYNTAGIHWRYSEEGGANPNTGVDYSTGFAYNTWYYVVGVKNGSNFKFYIDGSLVQDITVANPKTIGVSALKFGTSNTVVLKEFKIYNSDLMWYSGSCGGTFVGTGPSITVSPTTSTDYYVRAEGACNTTGCVSQTVTVRPLPTATIGGTVTVCQYASSPSVTFTNPQAFAITITYNINGSGTTTINVPASSTNSVSAPTGTPGTFAYNLVSTVYQDGSPGCSNSVGGTATITVSALPTFQVTVTNVSCYGGNDGSIKVTIDTGPANYMFSKDGGSTWTSPQSGTEYTFTGLTVAGGPYTIAVTDGVGCVQTNCTVPGP